MGRPALALAVAALTNACASEYTLLVDVRTDHEPREEFTTVRVQRYRGARLEGAADPEATSAREAVGDGRAFLAGVRAAEWRGLAGGSYAVRVVLLDGAREVGARTVQVELSEDAAVGVFVARQCAGSTVDDCEPVDCRADGDCDAPAATCAEARCLQGACTVLAVPDACVSDEWCDPASGCARRTAGPVDPADGGDAGDALDVGDAGDALDVGDAGDARDTADTGDALDGAAPPPATLAWVKMFGGAGNDYARALSAIDGGSVFVAGSFADTIDFGRDAYSALSGRDGVVVELAGPTGATLWSAHYADMGSGELRAVAVDRRLLTPGRVVLGGWFEGNLDVGGVPLTSSGDPEGYLLRYQTTAPVDLGARTLGGGDPDYPYSVATDSAGNVYVAGEVSGIPDFGGTSLTCHGLEDAFIASYEADTLALRWAHLFGSENTDRAYAVTTDGSGRIFVAGSFVGSAWLDTGSGTMLLSGSPFGVSAAFLIAFESSGARLWWTRVEALGSGNVAGYALGSTSDGRVCLAGEFGGSAGFTDGGLPVSSRGGTQDAFAACYDAATGDLDWAATLGSDDGPDRARGMAVTTSTVLLGGFHHGAMAVGSSVLPAAPEETDLALSPSALFVAALDLTSGDPLWALSAAGDGYDEIQALAASGPSAYVAGFASPGATLLGTDLGLVSTDWVVARIDLE